MTRPRQQEREHQRNHAANREARDPDPSAVEFPADPRKDLPNDRGRRGGNRRQKHEAVGVAPRHDVAEQQPDAEGDEGDEQEFHGYATNPTVYCQNYQRWSQTSLDTTLGALRAAGLQNQQMASEESIVGSLEFMSETADGQMQALNVLGQISDQQVQQLMKLRELMMADMSSKQAYQAAIIQEQAADQAATQWFFIGGPVTSDGKTYLPGLQ